QIGSDRPSNPVSCTVTPGTSASAGPAIGASPGTAVANIPGRPGISARYGRVPRCGLTVLAKWNPLLASQLIDQVIAPRIDGHVDGGLKLPQLVPRARQSSAALRFDGSWNPPPAACDEAGSPSTTWSGRSALCNWMQASA